MLIPILASVIFRGLPRASAGVVVVVCLRVFGWRGGELKSAYTLDRQTTVYVGEAGCQSSRGAIYM